MDKKVDGKGKKRFKQTKPLVLIAKRSGLTQKEIADMCRVSQPTISSWETGAAKAKEHQVQPLLEMFGYKLRRKTFKVYWAFNPDSDESTYLKVEGRVIMNHAFTDDRGDSVPGRKLKNVPTRKLVVHDQGKGKYLLVKQRRVEKVGSSEFVECSIPEAAWTSEIVGSGPMESGELIKYIDKNSDELLDRQLSDAVTLPFLIRQALLYAGAPVDKVVDYPSNW